MTLVISNNLQLQLNHNNFYTRPQWCHRTTRTIC